MLVKLLEPIGFELQEAENGKDAIAIWETWRPHLIWMDMRMPVMDGYEATQHIKQCTMGQAWTAMERLHNDCIIELLCIDPFAPQLRTHKLKGELKDSWACSAGYDLRIIFKFVDFEGTQAILLESIGTHDEVY